MKFKKSRKMDIKKRPPPKQYKTALKQRTDKSVVPPQFAAASQHTALQSTTNKHDAPAR